MEKSTIEDIKEQIRETLSRIENNSSESVESTSLENTLSYTKEQYAEINIGLKQVKGQALFPVKEVIDSLR